MWAANQTLGLPASRFLLTGSQSIFDPVLLKFHKTCTSACYARPFPGTMTLYSIVFTLNMIAAIDDLSHRMWILQQIDGEEQLAMSQVLKDCQHLCCVVSNTVAIGSQSRRVYYECIKLAFSVQQNRKYHWYAPCNILNESYQGCYREHTNSMKFIQ